MPHFSIELCPSLFSHRHAVWLFSPLPVLAPSCPFHCSDNYRMISIMVTWLRQVLEFPFVLFPLPPSPVWTAAHLSNLNVLPCFLRSCPSSETLSSAHVLVLNSVLPGAHPKPLFSYFDMFHEWDNSHWRHFTLSEPQSSPKAVSPGWMSLMSVTLVDNSTHSVYSYTLSLCMCHMARIITMRMHP